MRSPMLAGRSGVQVHERFRFGWRKLNGERVENTSEAFSQALTAFAGDIARAQRSAPPIGLVQVARYADPRNSSAALLLAILFDSRDREDEALAILRSIPADDALSSEV